jgi:hypothetical protein
MLARRGQFYAEMCRVERWSVRTLRERVRGMLFEHTSISRKPEEVARRELQELRELDRIGEHAVRAQQVRTRVAPRHAGMPAKPTVHGTRVSVVGQAHHGRAPGAANLSAMAGRRWSFGSAQMRRRSHAGDPMSQIRSAPRQRGSRSPVTSLFDSVLTLGRACLPGPEGH